jgi:hypothetical protein
MYRVVGKEARIREGTKKEKTVSEEVGGLAKIIDRRFGVLRGDRWPAAMALRRRGESCYRERFMRRITGPALCDCSRLMLPGIFEPGTKTSVKELGRVLTGFQLPLSLIHAPHGHGEASGRRKFSGEMD